MVSGEGGAGCPAWNLVCGPLCKTWSACHEETLTGLYQQLTSAKAAILKQMRTGKTFLKEYLHKIKTAETAACDYVLAESKIGRAHV